MAKLNNVTVPSCEEKNYWDNNSDILLHDKLAYYI